jgi:uncharacterized protein YutE (UPF0331/DUF86 family)
MKSRIRDKIQEINNYLAELKTIIPKNFEEYEGDIKTKAACERYFEIIIEAIEDLSFLIIEDLALKKPETEKEIFRVLLDQKIIDEKLLKRIQNAKGMRNILAHEYGRINDELVFSSIKEEIISDAQEFLNKVGVMINV